MKPLNVKLFLKNWMYRTGFLGTYHRFKNRKQLTVVMFHRVLPACDSRYAGADPEWTMTPDSFSRCLHFFKRHYHVVSPDQAFSALRGETQLPDRSLLITFDDGWADTAEYAHPILEKFSMRALIFVAGKAVNQTHPFWEEWIYSLLTTLPDGATKLSTTLKKHGISISAPDSSQPGEEYIRAIIKQLGQIKGLEPDDIVRFLREVSNPESAMLNTGQLAQLISAHHAIGGHGMTHRPLTKVQELDKELMAAQSAISALSNGQLIHSMSFPHGAYSDTVIEKCKSSGYQYLFSSDAHLNTLEPVLDELRPVGRIHISERAIADHKGNFCPALLASWLFLRPSRHAYR